MMGTSPMPILPDLAEFDPEEHTPITSIAEVAVGDRIGNHYVGECWVMEVCYPSTLVVEYDGLHIASGELRRYQRSDEIQSSTNNVFLPMFYRKKRDSSNWVRLGEDCWAFTDGHFVCLGRKVDAWGDQSWDWSIYYLPSELLGTQPSSAWESYCLLSGSVDFLGDVISTTRKELVKFRQAVSIIDLVNSGLYKNVRSPYRD